MGEGDDRTETVVAPVVEVEEIATPQADGVQEEGAPNEGLGY